MLPLYDALVRYAAATRDALLTARLASALQFEITNVAEWCRDTFAQDEKVGVLQPLTDSLRHIPNVAPVANVMWFEYRPVYEQSKKDCTAQGCLSAVYCDVVRYPGSYDALRGIVAEFGADPPPLPPGARWLILNETFMIDRDPSPVPGVPYIWRSDHLYTTVVSETGRILGFNSSPNPLLRTHKRDNALIAEQEHVIAMSALSFLHCKNVAVREHGPSRQERRALERARRPVTTYKTLDIAPMTRVLRDEGQIEKHGTARALHICRGHFATYTDEHPLFGKYTGQFYRPDHVRGTKKAGEVVKDYRVLTGAGQ